MLQFLFIYIFLIYSQSPQAESSEPVFGPEFTFTSPDIMRGTWDSNRLPMTKIIERANNHLIGGQEPAARFRVAGKMRLESPNGWWFQVTPDVGVVEIKMSPLSVNDWKRFAVDIQDAVFVTAANEGLYPALFAGGGHITVHLKIFRNNVLLARNFIVDYWNHNELAMGAFGYDTHNALSLWLNHSDIQSRVEVAIEDMGDITNIASFLMGIKLQFRGDRNLYQILWNKGQTQRHLDLNFSAVGSDRLEIRSLRPQVDIKTWINQIELIQARVEYLSRFTERIPLKMRVPFTTTPLANFSETGHALNPPIDPELALRSFYQYVTESGLKWDDHRSYVWPSWITSGALASFESSEWFFAEEFSCAHRLK